MSVENTLKTGLITGRFGVGVADGPDVGDDPDVIPAQGRITFTQIIGHQPNVSASPPVTVLRVPITGVLDAEGYLCTPSVDDPLAPGRRGLRLFATDDPNGGVTGWTYKVTYAFKPTNYGQPSLMEHNITVPSDSAQDLTTLVPVPSTPGYGLPQAEAAALRAEASSLASAESSAQSAQSAADAEALAQSVRDDADAGAFDGLSAYQIWLGLGNTGTEADFINWLKGAKGDPGGLVMGTLIPDSADLQTYVTPGLYRKAGGTVINGPADLQQPYFSMMVIASEPGRVQQIIWPGATGQYGKLFWTNAKAGTTWAGWRATVTTRFDKTVGTAVYAWDSAANADRLIAGETDVYTIAPIGGFTGKITIQRSGNVVTVNVDNLSDAAATSTHFAAMPAGFRPPVDNDSVGLLLSGTAMRQVFRSGSNLRLATRSGTVAGSLSFITKDPWPTATPPPIA